MTSYAITAEKPTGDVTYTIGGGSNMHTAKISPDNTYLISAIGSLISVLKTGDEVYVTGLSENDFSALITDLNGSQGDIKISLYVKGCPDTDISFEETISKLFTLLFDGGKITSISTTAYQTFLLIVNDSETLTSVSFKGDKLDLSGCSKVTLSTTSLNWVILKLNGCSNIELEEVDLDINTTDVDFTDMGSITTLNCSNCKITAIDLSNTRISSINISDSIITTIKIPKKIDSLTISNLINEISIDSAKHLNVQECNVSCKNVNLENDYSSAISINNSGTIEKVSATGLQGINIGLEKCKELSLDGCTYVNCNADFFTTATDSLTIENTKFNQLSMNFESNNVEVSNISVAGNILNIRNYNGKTEDLHINNTISFDSCSIWSCPNINPSNINSDTIYLIDSPITELPSEWANDSIYLYSCHNIESISGTYPTLIAINCSKLKEVDVSNIELYRLIWNQSLDTIIKDGTIYGNSGELIDNLLANPTLLYGNILRFNAFKNLEIYSAPNIINGKLIYNKQYNIVTNTNTEVENSIGSDVNDKNINYTGLCTLGQDVTNDYSGGLGTYFIWIDFTNINTSPFTDPIDICGYNMNTDVKNGLIDMTSSYNSIYPQTIITDIPSSSFNNKNILVLSTSDLKPASEPNKFNINLIVY